MDKKPAANTTPGIIEIRRLDLSDAPSLFELTQAQGTDLDAFSWRKAIASPADEESFIAWATGAEQRGQAFCRLVLLDGEPCGCVSLYKPHPGAFPDSEAPSMQMGYWIGRFARGQKAGTRAMLLLMAEVSVELGPEATVGIRTRSNNGASLSCAAKLGLSVVGQQTPSMFDPNDIDLLLRGPLAPQVLALPRRAGPHP